jgi:hypothetical protein
LAALSPLPPTNFNLCDGNKSLALLDLISGAPQHSTAGNELNRCDENKVLSVLSFLHAMNGNGTNADKIAVSALREIAAFECLTNNIK